MKCNLEISLSSLLRNKSSRLLACLARLSCCVLRPCSRERSCNSSLRASKMLGSRTNRQNISGRAEPPAQFERLPASSRVQQKEGLRMHRGESRRSQWLCTGSDARQRCTALLALHSTRLSGIHGEYFLYTRSSPTYTSYTDILDVSALK